MKPIKLWSKVQKNIEETYVDMATVDFQLNPGVQIKALIDVLAPYLSDDKDGTVKVD